MNDSLSYLEVYKTLGPGLLESIYEKALLHELIANGLKSQSQVPVQIDYKGEDLGDGLRLGGFYKLISWDFGVVFEQIAVQNEGA